MKIYDITRTISEDLPVYPGDPDTKITRVSDVAKGDHFTLSSLTISTHVGTHADAPFHFFRNGMTVDEIPLDTLIGEAVVVSLQGTTGITALNLERCDIPTKTDRILIKTKSPALPQESEAYLSEDAAHWIVERDMKLFGIDTLSIDSSDDSSLAAHRVLLRSGVIILESLDLGGVDSGQYTIICLPLKIEEGDGAPARVVLLKEN